MEFEKGMKVLIDNPKSMHNGKKGEIVGTYMFKEKYLKIRIRFRNQVSRVITTTGLIELNADYSHKDC